MASITEDERKRILRERRQAKMAKGKASDRLNTILNQGSSVNANTAVSVLDVPEQATSTIKETKPTSIDDNTVHEDPEIQDIDTVIQKIARTDSLNENPAQPPDMDALFNQIFGGASGAGFPSDSTAPGADGNDNADPFTQMMMQMMGGKGGDINNPFAGSSLPQGMPEISTYDSEMAKYTEYQHQLYEWRFLIVRYGLMMFNFIYHFINEPFFRSSNLISVRSNTFHTSSFMTWFVSCEVAILSAYYVLCFNRFNHHVSGNSWVIKLLDMGLMVLPQLARYKQLVITLFGYYDLLSIILNDVSFMVILFGLTSYIT